MLRYSISAFVVLAAATLTASGGPLFEDPNGVVVMEIESGSLAKGHSWRGETKMEGYTGKGYYTWRGGNMYGSPGRGVIGFRFRISKKGKYHLRIRNRHDFHDSTEQNDCWTKLDNHKWIKTFSSKRGEWTWRTNFEYSGNNKPAAVWDLRAGTHTLLISGRSTGFSIDRIHLYLDGTPSKVGEDTSLPETRTGKKTASSAGRAAQTTPSNAKPKARSEILLATPAGNYPVKRVAPKIEGPMRAWQPVTLSFVGPALSEDGSPNPFTDFRMTATFTQGKRKVVAAGYYAADGQAGQSGAAKGNVWRVQFLPPTPGKWNVAVSFRHDPDVAISQAANAGKPAAFDGSMAELDIAPAAKSAPGFYAHGVLGYVGKRYFRFAGSGEWFLKGGADSPENLLGYADFDGTWHAGKGGKLKRTDRRARQKLHRYAPHVRDWRPGDPTWRGGKGKGLIGAVNYLASTGMNSAYFIPYNIDGVDGKDTWPWTEPDVRNRFDCSKLDQWQIVFGHMQKRGIAMHIILQETENDQGLDGGDLGPQRKLYLRELIARFAHNPAVVWNLGEENTNTTAQRKAMATYIRELDPYDHPIVLHTFPGAQKKIYPPLLGFDCMEGPSLQTSIRDVHKQTLQWIDASAKAGRQWVVCSDEIGPAHTGVKPDADDPAHDEIRQRVLWDNLLAGGAGVEYYFGYKFAHNDLNCEDWRSRANMWKQTAIALKFFHEHLPFTEMHHADELTGSADAWCLAKPGEIYAVYLPGGRATSLKLPAGKYSISWFNPRTGGKLKAAGDFAFSGPAKTVDLPAPPDKKDWVAVVKKHS